MHNYPGLGLPLRHYEQGDCEHYPIGAHSENYGAESVPLLVRELAMMDVMEKITDKQDWHTKVFDANIVSKWQKEALAVPDEELYRLATAGKTSWHVEIDGVEQLVLEDDRSVGLDQMPKGILNEQAFDSCVQELRNKAKYFEQTGIVPTLEACASVAKSDTVVTKELREALRVAFDKLRADQETSPDWHPNSGDMVQDLVHPSMYPLVYGRTRVLQEECVGVDDAIRMWAGKGTIVPKEDPEQMANLPGSLFRSVHIPPEYWSRNYQWLPANIAFQEDGSVRFTSYINNLHPNRFPGVYRTIEKLIETSLPLWDQCLAMAANYNEKTGAGRMKPRRALPDDPDGECGDNWLPNSAAGCVLSPGDEVLANNGHDVEDLKMEQWANIREPVLPEIPFEEIEYAPQENTRLKERFRSSGLQIIVKLASIELTPEKPEFPVGGWHIEGQMNEQICGTALYYLDSENITDSSLSFRMQTSYYLNDSDEPYSVGQDCYGWMECAFGTSLGSGNSPCLQNYGNVRTCEGRLLAFPNVFQHRVSPFKLIDPSKKGHRRFVALWLVDPTKRVISTANVPPQQMAWYMESLLGTDPDSRKDALAKLPAEIVDLLQEKSLVSPEPVSENRKLPAGLSDIVREYFETDGQHMPMGVGEAKEHRKKLMQERSAFVKTSEKGWQDQTYSFCEH